MEWGIPQITTISSKIFGNSMRKLATGFGGSFLIQKVFSFFLEFMSLRDFLKYQRMISQVVSFIKISFISFNQVNCGCWIWVRKLEYSWSLFLIKGVSDWKFVRIGETVFAKGSLSTLVVYNADAYLFVGGSAKTGKDLKQSGFYRYNEGIVKILPMV